MISGTLRGGSRGVSCIAAAIRRGDSSRETGDAATVRQQQQQRPRKGREGLRDTRNVRGSHQGGGGGGQADYWAAAMLYSFVKATQRHAYRTAREHYPPRRIL